MSANPDNNNHKGAQSTLVACGPSIFNRDLGKQPLVPGTRRDVSGKNCADGNKMEAIGKSWTKYSLQLVI